MADIFARQRSLIGSSAEWTANNIVLGQGEIGIERVSPTDVRIKVGDGVSTFSALPYASASSSTINAATQAALDAKVAKSGDTMTGLLVLSGDPAAPLGAATKQYVDAINASLTTALNGKLNTAGGTLTGLLTLSADPTSALHAATKQYVDALGAAKVSKAGDTMTGPLTLSADPTAAMQAATKAYVDNGSYQTVVGGSSAYAGKVVKLGPGGVLDTSLVPVSANYLGTVNLTLPYALTGTYSPGDYFATSATGTIDSSWGTRLNNSPTNVSAGQFIYFNANGRWDLVGDTSASAAIAGKVSKTGDTMTGLLILSGDPTAALGAATKQYADTKLAAAGGTLTGFLTLNANPTAALHAAPKQYVDGIDTAVRAAFAAADTTITTNYQAADNLRLLLAGGTMTGPLVLAADPTAALGAATKQYVDTNLALALRASNNLSDLANAATARTNLGLGTAALRNISVGTTAPASPAVNDLWVDTN